MRAQRCREPPKGWSPKPNRLPGSQPRARQPAPAPTTPPPHLAVGPHARGAGLGGGSGTDHRHERRRALQVAPAGVASADGRSRAAGVPRVDGRSRVALSRRECAGPAVRGGEDRHCGRGQGVGRHPVRRAPEPAQLGRSGRGGRDGAPGLFPAQGVPGFGEPGLHASCRELHSRHAPGEQLLVPCRRRHRLEVEDLPLQPGRQRRPSRRRGSRIHHHEAGFPGTLRRLRFLWFEHEAVVAGPARWAGEGPAADAIVQATPPLVRAVHHLSAGA